jgi:tetratricopeptide (TPR) repeat protein
MMTIDEQIREKQREQVNLLRQVRMALKNNEFDIAIKSLKQMVKLAQAGGNVGAEGRHLGNMALIYYRLNQPDRALAYFNRALELAREDEDELTQSGLLGNMGNILRETGRHQEAIERLNEALKMSNLIEDVRGRGIWLGNLGLVYDDLKQPEKAIELHNKSIEIARKLFDKRGLISRLTNIGNTHLAKGDIPAALTCFHEITAIALELNDYKELAVRLGMIGSLEVKLARNTTNPTIQRKHYASAIDHYAKTLTIVRQLHDPATEGTLLRSIGDTLVELGRYNQAVEYYFSARQLFLTLGMTEEAEESKRSQEVAEFYRK